MDGRSTPLVVVASASHMLGEEVATRLRQNGSVVYVTHSTEGCLRVATSVAPDVVVLDPALPPRLERLLRAHPTSASAQILHLSMPRATQPARPIRTPAATAGPHAA